MVPFFVFTDMNIYALTRRWWDWAFQNPSKVKPIHSALYFFAIEHCNRMGWKREYGFPTVMAMEAMGVTSYNTYKNGLNDLVDWGFITMIERSRNQYSANIIALSYFDEAYDKAHDEALDKALSKHATKHSRGMSDIDIQEYHSTNTTKDKSVQRKRFTAPSFEQVYSIMLNRRETELFISYYESNGWKVGKNPMKDWARAVTGWKLRGNVQDDSARAQYENYGDSIG
jgi:hypothetical protein